MTLSKVFSIFVKQYLDGGTGRHATLKMLFPLEFGFDSRLRYDCQHSGFVLKTDITYRDSLKTVEKEALRGRSFIDV